MDRAERRRHDRSARKGRTPVVIAGDGIVAASLGHQFEARESADLRPKVPGEHRIVASATYVLAPGIGPTELDDPTNIKLLDNENLMMLACYCWDCELPYDMLAPVCPGDSQLPR